MRVSSINIYQKPVNGGCCTVKKYTPDEQANPNHNINFNGFGGKICGGLIGAGFTGLCALAAMATPVGWVAAATLIAAEAGGAVVGGVIGDKVTGKDEDD